MSFLLCFIGFEVFVGIGLGWVEFAVIGFS